MNVQNRAQSILKELNPPQLAAVQTLHGPLMVLAGAGSGKTRVLTRRLAYIVASGAASADEVLAVTFTNKAAREMRERVAALLGENLEESRLMRSLWVGTFHGMGARILRQYGDKIGFDRNFTILDASDQERLWRKVLEETGVQSEYWSSKRLVSSVSRWKDDGLGPEQLTELHLRRDLGLVVGLYRAYQAALQKLNAMDFGDLLTACLTLWQNHPEVLDLYRDRFRFVLVDEYQDTNAVQYRWMRALASRHNNLCVVGDDDQLIYSWRGARMDNILRFSDDYPTVQVIRLEQNYRSTGTILKAAEGLITHNRDRMGKKLWTEGVAGTRVLLYTAEDGYDEARFVAAEIKRRCGDGQYNKVAVLVRTSWQTRPLEEALMRSNLPYQVVGGLRFMDRAEIKDAVAYLRLVYASRDDLAFERIINVPSRKLGPKALDAIAQTAVEWDCHLLEAARRVVAEKRITGVGLKGLEEFVAMIQDAMNLATAEPPEKVMDYLLKRSGYLLHLANEDKEEDRRGNLEELLSVLRLTPSVTDFLEQATLDSSMGEERGAGQGNRVVISTLHAAKGLEFPVVFLAGVEENILPHKMSMDQGPSGIEEERRLAYVGMTRAREQLILTRTRRRMTYGVTTPSLPSRFLTELPADAVEERSGETRVRSGSDRFSASSKWRLGGR